jgi:secondary thiamine-phosphate synthase enzyme
MAAHIRAVLTQSEITIPIQRGRLALGSWQGLFLWEHRYHAHRRNLTVTLTGVPG